MSNQELLDQDPSKLTTGQLNVVKIIVLFNPLLTPEERMKYKEKFGIQQPKKTIFGYRYF